jgi:hypothetical protein
MTMRCDIFDPTSVVAKSVRGGRAEIYYWLTIEDQNGNEITIHTTRKIAEAVAGAFAEATKPVPAALENCHDE